MKGPAYGALWDMDGVLVDSGRAHFESWQQMWREEGVDFPETAFHHTFGQRTPEIIRALLGPHVADARIEELGDRKESYYRELVRQQVTALPGALELVRQLRAAGFRQAVATSAPRANLDLILDVLSLRQEFDATVSAEDVSHGKPDPQIFLLAAQHIGLPPARCVVFEDALVGIEAAHGGGMKVIAVATTNPAERLRHANLVVESLAELTVAQVRQLIDA